MVGANGIKAVVDVLDGVDHVILFGGPARQRGAQGIVSGVVVALVLEG